jgi:hypothetical protein
VVAQVPTFDYAYAFGATVPYTSGNIAARQSAADAVGNVYVIGRFLGAVVFGSTTLMGGSYGNDAFVAKLRPDGQWQWALKITSAEANDIAVDNAGNVYLTGEVLSTSTFGSITLGNAGAQDVFVAKLTSAGQWLWAVSGGGPYTDNSYGITVDSGGNAYITGALHSISAAFGSTSLSGRNNQGIGLYVAKVTANGAWQWVAISTQTNPTVVNRGNQLVLDATGNVYVAGIFYSSTLTLGDSTLTNAGSSGAISNDIFVAKLSAAGRWQWAIAAGGSSSDYANELVTDGNGNLYIGGELQSAMMRFGTITLGTPSTSSTAAYVAKLTATGQWQWATQSGLTTGGGSGSAFGRGLAVSADGSTYVTGFFSGRPRFGTTTLIGISQDVYVAKLMPSGQWQWALRAGGSGNEIAHGISLDLAGNAYLTGAFSSPTLSFDAITLLNTTAPTNNLGFVARLASMVLANTAPATLKQTLLQLSPNPAQQAATVAIEPVMYSRTLELLSATGQVMRRLPLLGGSSRAHLDVAGLPSGLYVVRCGNVVRKLFVE